MKRIALIIVGFLLFGLGMIGILIPVLPTTPLLLAAGFCFTRSSERFTVWLQSTRIYQFYVADFASTGSIPRKRKWAVLLNIYLLMSISIFLAPIAVIKIMLILLTCFLTYMLFYIIPDKEE